MQYYTEKPTAPLNFHLTLKKRTAVALNWYRTLAYSVPLSSHGETGGYYSPLTTCSLTVASPPEAGRQVYSPSSSRLHMRQDSTNILHIGKLNQSSEWFYKIFYNYKKQTLESKPIPLLGFSVLYAGFESLPAALTICCSNHFATPPPSFRDECFIWTVTSRESRA